MAKKKKVQLVRRVNDKEDMKDMHGRMTDTHGIYGNKMSKMNKIHKMGKGKGMDMDDMKSKLFNKKKKNKKK